MLDSPDAPSTYTYDFGDDVALVLLEDGSVEVTEDLADGVTAVLGTIDAPWAVDTEGTDVPTHYTVDGPELTQHVAHSSAYAYPVTADPTYRKSWWNMTVYFNRYETRRIATRTNVAGLLSFLPSSIARAVGASAITVSATFNWYYDNGQCGKLVSYGSGLGAYFPQQYGGSEAGGYCR